MKNLIMAIGLLFVCSIHGENLTYKIHAYATTFGAVTDNSGATNYNYHFLDSEESNHFHVLSFVEEPQLNSDRALKALTNSAFAIGGGNRAVKATLYLSCQNEPFCWDEKGREYCSFTLKNSATGSHPSNCVLNQYYVGEFK